MLFQSPHPGMPMHHFPLRALLVVALLLPVAAGAQSLNDGGLLGSVVDTEGRPIAEAAVTLERDGLAYRIVTTDGAGRFRFSPLAAGRYAVLAEQVGFQPVRVLAVGVVAGSDASVQLRLERRPPPILAPTDQVWSGGVASGSRLVEGLELYGMDRRRDATDVTRGIAEADAPRMGRPGMVGTAGGMLPSAARLFVDGAEELLLRHPGMPDEGATAPIFSRDGTMTAEWVRDPRDAEWRAGPGGLLALQSARGGGTTFIRPWATYSGSSLAGATADNPADSSASSLQVGVAMGGAIKADTAAWFLRADYQKLAMPSTAAYLPAAVAADFADGLDAAFTGVGAPTDVASSMPPPVRTWEGLTAAGRLDWGFGADSRLMVRFGAASWSEDAPIPGSAPQQGSGTRLEATDVSGLATFTTGGPKLTSETRLGVRSASRDWTDDGLTAGYLTSEGIGFGGVATLRGEFSERLVDLNQGFLYASGSHRVKVGGSIASRAVTYDWLANAAGRAEYGSLADLAAGTGTWMRTSASDAAADLAVREIAFFAQDAIRITPEIELLIGVRYETQKLPTDAIQRNEEWANASGFRNETVPDNTSGAIGPRAGFTWDLGGAGRTIVRGTGGILPGRYDLATFAEAARADGAVTTRRANGAIGWPDAALGIARTTLTTYGPEVRQPRTYAGALSLSQVVAPATSLHLALGYRHTDYLVRRTDLNRAGGQAATSADGRAIWGDLEQYGGVIAAAPGSNRRFDEFDHVFGLASTGFADYQEATISLERRAGRGLTLLAGYTWSRTEDNLPGQLSADPADRLAPFDGVLDGAAWEDGRSDLDVPHRVALTAMWEAPHSSGLRVAARWHWRSGLPFTPGFRAGVDANGDGSSRNDPVAPGSVAGLSNVLSAAGCSGTTVGGFATRNSCREAAVQGLDLHAAIGLPLGIGRRISLTVDLFNLGASEVGIVDRAAVLVDPTGTISFDQAGRTVLPLIANERFGQLLARRGDPRMLRIGLRAEN